MLALHIIRAAASAVALACMALADLDLPKHYWGDKNWILYASVFFLALDVLPPRIVAALQASRASSQREYDRNAHSLLSVTLLEVAGITGTPVDQIGVHAFLARGWWRWRRLINVGGLRLRATPSMDSSKWRPGKGVVGLAWDVNHYVVRDWDAVLSSQMAMSAPAWEAAPESARYGLSWGELDTTRDYKRIIAARPIRDLNKSDKRIGCVSLDAPGAVAEFQDPRVDDELRELSVAIARLGRPPAAWLRYS